MLKNILIAIAVAIGGLCAYAAMQPDNYQVVRAATVNAPPEALFPLVNDFKNWAKWSPWEKLDPAMKKTFSGAESGVGAKYAWSGNDQVGEGSMAITESQPSNRIALKLEFIKPWESSAENVFSFQSEGAATKVTWTMNGSNNFVSKLFGVFMNMDRMIGADFEKGLAQLKSATEAK